MVTTPMVPLGQVAVLVEVGSKKKCMSMGLVEDLADKSIK